MKPPMPDWISCADRLPPEDADVTVKLADGTELCGVYGPVGWMLDTTPLFCEGKEMPESPVVAWKEWHQASLQSKIENQIRAKIRSEFDIPIW